MIDGYLEKNLNALAIRDPLLADRLADFNPESDWQIYHSKDGLITVKRICGADCFRYIHSRVSPQNGADKWTEFARVNAQTLVVLGFGLGYHVLTLQEKCPPDTLVVIDADLDLFHLAVRLTDLRPIIRDPKAHLLIGKTISEVQDFLSNFSESSLGYREYLPATGLHPEYYQYTKDVLEDTTFKYRLLKDSTLSQGVVKLLEETRG